MRASNWAGILTVAALLAGAAAPSSSIAAPNRWGANYFPNVELITHEGRTVRFYDDLLKGKSVAINFIYTDCKEVCPLETANLVRVYKLLGERAGRDIAFYSISIDPKRDTPEVLKAYRDKFGAQWLFLTGKQEDIRLLGRKLGVLRERDVAAGSHHSAQIVLGHEPGGQWQRNSAVDNPPFLAARMGIFFGWRDPQPGKSYADARPVTVHNGQRLFASKCSTCHTVGQGDKLGPDLVGVTDRRGRAWLARYISEPDAVLASGDPIAGALFEKYKKIRMPNLKLGSSDVNDLIYFLEERTSAVR